MSEAPLLTIVTVCRDAAEVIGRALDSVGDQVSSEGGPFKDFEHLIIDGVSTDETLEIAGEYARLQERRGIAVTVVSEPDEGIYDAMNKGLALARGRYVGFLNADDCYEPQALATVAELAYGHDNDIIANRHEADCIPATDCLPAEDYLPASDHVHAGQNMPRSKAPDCIGGACEILELDTSKQSDPTLTPKEWILGTRKPMPEMLTERYPEEMPVQHQALFVRTDLLREMGGFRTQFPIAADYDLCLRLIELSRSHADSELKAGDPDEGTTDESASSHESDDTTTVGATHPLHWVFTDEVLACFTIGGASFSPIRTARDYRAVRLAHGWPLVFAHALYIRNAAAALLLRVFPL